MRFLEGCSMRKTKALQFVSVAVGIATPSLVLAAAPAKGRSLRPATGWLGSVDAVGAAQPFELSAITPSFQDHVQQLSNTPNWIGPINGSWTVGTNWSTGTAPHDATDAGNFILLSDSTAANQAILDTNQTVGSLTFNTPFRS